MTVAATTNNSNPVDQANDTAKMLAENTRATSIMTLAQMKNSFATGAYKAMAEAAATTAGVAGNHKAIN